MRKRFEALGLILAMVLVWSAYPQMPLLAYWLCHVVFAFLAMLLVYGVLLEGHLAGPCMVWLFMLGLGAECIEMMIPWSDRFVMAGVTTIVAPLDLAFEMMGGLIAVLLVKAGQKVEV